MNKINEITKITVTSYILIFLVSRGITYDRYQSQLSEIGVRSLVLNLLNFLDILY